MNKKDKDKRENRDIPFLMNSVEMEYMIKSQRDLELMYLGLTLIPEDTRTEGQKDLNSFKWAIDENNKLYWHNKKTGVSRDTDGNYGKGEICERVFKRWARGMDL